MQPVIGKPSARKFFFFFQAEDGIRDYKVTGVQTCALPICINARGEGGVTAEHLKVGGVEMAETSGYDVIVDRISHDIPFYRSFLKNAVLTGTKVINNPFWWSADDK